MKSSVLSLILFFVGLIQVRAQQPENYLPFFTAENAREHLEFLASDDLEGREAGMEGQKRAAAYLMQQFSLAGIPKCNGTYFQRFRLRQLDPYKLTMQIDGDSLHFMKDFLHNADFANTQIENADLVFVGFGIHDSKYSDYSNIDVKGKVVLIIDGEPKLKNGTYLISGSESRSKWSERFAKVQEAHKRGALAVVAISERAEYKMSIYKHYFGKKKMNLETDTFHMPIPVLVTTPKIADSLLISGGIKKGLLKTKNKLEKKQQSLSKVLTHKVSIQANCVLEELTSENVLAFIEGTDKKDEVIVITAHYDHIGVHGDHVFNGADDDASGTTALILLAEAFARAKSEGYGPRRSILIMPVSAEEKGLLGSRYYSENPIFPLENTVANLNIDMIGREDEAHKGNPNYVYLIGSNFLSQELHDINEAQNKKHTQLELDYTFNSTDDPNRFYERSDHYNFAKHGIPVIFYFNGVHEDYHQHTDTADKIDFEKVAHITQLIFFTAWELANREDRVKVDNP